MDPITGGLIGAGLNFLGSLITTPEEARAMDLQQKKIENDNKSLQLREYEAKNATALAANAAKSAERLAILENAAQQKQTMVIAGVAVLGIGVFAAVMLTRGK